MEEVGMVLILISENSNSQFGSVFIFLIYSKLTWLSFYQCSEINDEKNFIEVLSHFPNLTYLDVSKDPLPDQMDVACKDTLPSPIVTEDIMKQAAKFRHLKYLDISGKLF